MRCVEMGDREIGDPLGGAAGIRFLLPILQAQGQ